MSEYVLAAEAELDLHAIWEYIAADNKEVADGWLAKLFDAFEALAAMPKMGHARPDLTAFPVLFWPVGAYLIIYRAQSTRVRLLRSPRERVTSRPFCNSVRRRRVSMRAERAVECLFPSLYFHGTL